MDLRDFIDLDEEEEKSEIKEIREVTLGSPEYPYLLSKIDKPPKVLYAVGNVNLLQKPAVAIVGTRELSEEGAIYARKIAEFYARQGFVIVSGLALGADTIAIKSALKSGGRVIAVLPTLEKITKNGTYGVLKSLIPPVTGGVWLALATGRNPGKTGIIDFLNRKGDKFKLYPVTSNDFIGISIWDYISESGKKVGIINYPMLYPSYEINGFMISGVGAPANGRITYPPSLIDEIKENVGFYQIQISYNDEKYDNLELFIDDVWELSLIHI